MKRIPALLLRAALCWLCLAAAARASPEVSASVPLAPALYRSGGQTLLRYEIHLTNHQSGPVELAALAISDSVSGRVLDTLAEARLAPLVQPLDQNRPGGAAPSLALAGGEQAVVYIDLAIPARRVPRRLGHRLTYSFAGSGEARMADVAPVAVAHKPAHVIGPPLSGGPWVAVHHAGWQRGHRRMFYTEDGKTRLPGRFAIDFVGVTQAGKVSSGNPDRPADALGYGAEVIAVADATVAAVRDGMAEAGSIAANGRHAPQDAAGNYLVLDLGQGRYAFYEHLKPGSIAVRTGQRVRRGDTIGALGFTGDSTGPHLHFHIADGPAPLGAEGLPFVIDKFTQHGRYADIGLLGKQAWSASPARIVRERPAENAVVDFGARTPGALNQGDGR